MPQLTRIPDGHVASPRGFLAAAVAAEIKYRDRLDLALVVSERDCTAAAMFTRNEVVAAPVVVDRQTLAANPDGMRAVVINAGNANACTGQQGMDAALGMQDVTAEALGLQPEQIFVMSTGVIGLHLPEERVAAGIQAAALRLAPDGGPDAARAIMTTDTQPKRVALSVELAGGTVIVAGMAKGAGMIHPDMATMLALLTTDAAVPADLLQEALREAVEISFNRISIDGDTSTNDTALLLANGAAGVSIGEVEREAFQAALNQVCLELAQAIVRDGEGAGKFVELRVSSLRTEADALAIARTVVTSPLVKTALAGNDANWGRYIAAAGRAGVALDASKIALWISADKDHWLQLVSGGMPTGYREADAAAIFAADEIHVHLDFAQGQAGATYWTCDLGHDYVSINADYRT